MQLVLIYHFSSSRLYTLEEDKLMLSFICDNERYDHIQGKKIWIEMQNTILSSKQYVFLNFQSCLLTFILFKNINEPGNRLRHAFLKP